MVRQQQQIFYGKRYSATCLRQHKECPNNCKGPGKDCPVYEPDFVKWAESYGAKGIRVTNTEEMNAAFEEAKKNKKTSSIIEFMIATEDIVLPMVKSGTAIHLFFIPTFLLFQNHLAHCSSTLNHRKMRVCPV